VLSAFSKLTRWDPSRAVLYTHAPRYLKGAAARTFSDNLMSTWPAIKAEITPAIVQAAISRDQPKSGDYLHIEWTNRNTQIALLKIDQRGNKTYHIQWLDSQNAPHDTGRTLGQAALTHAQITQAITWRTVQPQDEDDSDDGEDIDPAHYLQIAGSATTTFPSPDGWTTVQPSKTITNLTHLTIPIITQLYTEPHIRNTHDRTAKKDGPPPTPPNTASPTSPSRGHSSGNPSALLSPTPPKKNTGESSSTAASLSITASATQTKQSSAGCTGAPTSRANYTLFSVIKSNRTGTLYLTSSSMYLANPIPQIAPPLSSSTSGPKTPPNHPVTKSKLSLTIDMSL